MRSSIFPPVFRTALRGLVPGPTSTDVSSQRILRADGVWVDQPVTLPSVTGNSGRLLTNNGTVASWTPAFTVDAVSGAAAVAAQGSNQNITLTPSGTGFLQVNGSASVTGSLSASGNITATGTSQRLVVNTSASTQSERFAIQSGVTNGALALFGLPNGTNGVATIGVLGDSAYTAGQRVRLAVTKDVSTQLVSDTIGGATALPLGIVAQGVEVASFSSTGLSVTGTLSATGAANFNGGMVRSKTGGGFFESWYDATPSKASRFQTLVGGGMLFGTYDGVSWTDNLTLTSTGLGIGTTNPTVKLSVDAGSGNNDQIQLVSTDTSGSLTAKIANGSGEAAFGVSAVGDLIVRGRTSGKRIRFDINNSEKACIDSSGNLGIGTTSPGAALTVNKNAAAAPTPLTGSLLQVLNADSTTTGVEIIGIGSGLQPRLNFRRGVGTAASPTAVGSNTNIGYIVGTGYDGTSWSDAQAAITFLASQNWTSTAHGTNLLFSTTSDGSTTLTERMRITAAGNIVAGASAALATTATDGFLYVPTCAGTPTGTPTAITGMAPIVVNTTNNKLYFYSGGAWRDAGP